MDIKTANRLYELRKKKGLSQEALAEKLGISRQSVSKWERAESSPDTDNLIALAKLYGVSLDELLLGEEKEENPTEDKTSQESGGDEADILSEDEEYQKYVDEGWESTIDCDSGDKIRVGKKAVYVHDRYGNNVRIGLKDGIKGLKDGIKINGEKPNKDLFKHGHLFHDEVKSSSKALKAFRAFPYPVAAFTAFLALGLSISAWWWCWLWLLTIPLYSTLVKAIEKKNPSYFAYPVLAVIIFFVLGFFVSGAWTWCWLVFLTIPLYYGIFGKKPKK